MKLFGSQKRRVSRTGAHRAPAHAKVGPLTLRHQSGRLLRISIALLAALVILVGLQSWKYPFTHRVGDRFAEGLSARITFKVINKFETARASEEREKEVPLIFRNHPEYLEDLPAQLKASLGAIAEADTLEDLPEQVRRSFELQVNKSPDLKATGSGDSLAAEAGNDAKFRFEQIKQAITPLDSSQSETHIASIVDEFNRFIQPLKKTGIIDPVELNREGVNLNSLLAVVPKNVDLPEPNPLENVEEWIAVRITDVTLTDLLNDAGFLTQRWSDFPMLETFRQPMQRWLRNRVRPTLEFDQTATQVARRYAGTQVEPVYTLINAGDEFLPPNGVIDQDLLNTLLAEYNAAQEQFPWEAGLARAAIVFCLIAMFFSLTGWYLIRFEPAIINSWPRLAIYLLVVGTASILARWVSFDPMRAEVAVVMAVTMIMTIAYNQRLAIVTAFMLSVLVCFSTRIDISQFVVILASSIAAVTCLQRVQSRNTITVAGFLAGAVALITSWGMEIILYPSAEISYWWDWSMIQVCLKYSGWCILAGFILAGSMPFIESTFGVVTGISLLEMSDQSHPLLQELIRRAPGTYNHSLSVAIIAESAAKRIGADSLLVRVGAYFHDIGKMPKAEYFIENRGTGMPNKHDSLAPAMSTLIIIGHVKDGVELAEEYHLPQVLIDFIEQHHGTTLVEYFYHAANKMVEADPDRKSDVEEAAFRYPGPKPQSKETGILMLSDCVESASRSLSEPTPARIRTLVNKLTMKRLLDGQFDECNLKLSEIHEIEESLIKSLISMYHGRITYPEQVKEQKSA